MPRTRICPQCGSKRFPEQVQGLCPRCLQRMLNKLEKAHPDLELREDGKEQDQSMKNPIHKTILAAALSLATLMLQSSTLHAQGTAFTYQGQLKDGAASANGSYDLTFSLFGVSTGGSA